MLRTRTKKNKDGSLSVKQVAKKLNVNYYTVVRWIREKRIKARKVVVHGYKAEWRIAKSQLRRVSKTS